MKAERRHLSGTGVSENRISMRSQDGVATLTLPLLLSLRKIGAISPASKPRTGLPLCRRLERSPKGEAIESIAFPFAVVFFLVFSPKIACQAPKPPKSFKQKNIELAC